MGKVTGFLEIEREQPARRKVEDRLQDWFEIYQPFPEEKQREQGARCMDCGVPFCHTGCPLTNIIPDFKAERWSGFLGEIVDAPFLPICRSQIDVAYKFPDARLAENMPGFHWMTGYGDYSKELGYALKQVGIEWEFLG